ncbi:PPK2 family polyphosphate kinase [Novosphingobium aerophilum]|uniref:PPK2 family polyphosphate kinase n=1 Tax=Novosphingobium aerophilum TaxID=2839843 RepID=UPI00163D6608
MGFAGKFRVHPHDTVHLGALGTRACRSMERIPTKAKTRRLVESIGDSQYLLYAGADRSLLIVLQGPDASGKDGLIRHVFSGVNPQGVKVTPFGEPSEAEARHDFLWRVHRRAPAKGEIAIFNRSHYEAVLAERVRKLVPREIWAERYALINSFEALLAENGTEICKFYLNISAEEQLMRFRRRLEDKSRQWKIDEADYSDRKLWREYQAAAEEMLRRTSTKIAPWYVIPSDHKWFRNYAVSRIILRSLRRMRLRTPRVQADIAEIKRKFHDAAGG